MIVFRADGNSKIGAGHIMRCLSVAQALRRRGEECVFVLADDAFKSPVGSLDFKTIVLNSDYSDMEGETEAFGEIIRALAPKCVLIDSYFVTERYLECIGRLAKTAYMDDVAAFAYPVDTLINYNVFAESLDYSALYRAAERKQPKMLLGLGYVPLREEFQNLKPPVIHREAKKVLVSTGGADTMHLALALLDAIRASGMNEEFDFHFVIGALNRDKPQIERIADGMRGVELHSNVRNMSALIKCCDIVISASGSTLYEISACGIPMIVYALADNQLPATSSFADIGAALSLGDLRDCAEPAQTLLAELSALAVDHKLRAKMSRKMRTIVDGAGADRIAAALTDG
jgi:UDP-2,4-diacetamido-2,4,6-trideoxy-beta-L-altropyranose hydrolase